MNLDHEPAWRAEHVPGSKEYRAVHSAAKTTKAAKFPALWVTVRDGTVYGGLWDQRRGALAGSHAEITDGSRPHRVAAGVALAPLTLGGGLLVALTKGHKVSAFIVFADGSVYERKISGKSAVRKAQAETVRYNALAAASS